LLVSAATFSGAALNGTIDIETRAKADIANVFIAFLLFLVVGTADLCPEMDTTKASVGCLTQFGISG